jgi:uncharacterized protein YcfL
MRKLGILFIIAAILAVACCPKASAQTTQEKVVINTSDLSPDQLAKIKAQQELETMQQKLDTYGKWVGVAVKSEQRLKKDLMLLLMLVKIRQNRCGKFTM